MSTIAYAEHRSNVVRRTNLLHLGPMHLADAHRPERTSSVQILPRELALGIFLNAFDGLGVGVLVVSSDRTVLHANAIATAILRRSQELVCQNGRLHIRAAEADKAFARQICLAASRHQPAESNTTLAVPCSDGHSSAMLIFGCNGGGPADQKMPAAIVLIGDRKGEVCINGEAFARLYGLTRAETRLLTALIQGKQLAEYAALARITINTAKSHLKQLFQKTGSSRQADLIRLVLANPMLRIASGEGKIGQAS